MIVSHAPVASFTQQNRHRTHPSVSLLKLLSLLRLE